MLKRMGEADETRWRVDRRRYFFDRWEDGIAERVRAERRDDVAWVRVLEAVYWWPAHEGKEWPAVVITAPVWGGVGPEPHAWSHFEVAMDMNDSYRWEALPGDSTLG
jgi:hypothetical protein